MFYFWQVAASILGVIIVALFIIGLFIHVKDEISSGTSNSNSNQPKYYDNKYKYKSEIEKQMSYLQSTHTQIRGWNVKEINSKLVIEVFCSSVDKNYIEDILRKYFNNEIRFYC